MKTTFRATAVALAAGLVYLTACQKEESNPQSDAAVARQTITSQGGSLVSLDKAVTVTLPAGAVTASTGISIERTVQTAPKGIGKVYKITPEGTVFAKPVSISFAYTDADAAKTNPALMAVAYKKADGNWEVMGEVRIDEKNKTITTQSRHFSEWTLLEAEEGITFMSPAIAKTTFSVVGRTGYESRDYGLKGTDTVLSLVARPLIPTGSNDYIDIYVSKSMIDAQYAFSGKDLWVKDNTKPYYVFGVDLPDRECIINFDFATDGSARSDSACYIKVAQIGRKVGEYNVGSFSVPIKHRLTQGDTLAPPIKEVMTGYFRIKSTR